VIGQSRVEVAQKAKAVALIAQVKVEVAQTANAVAPKAQAKIFTPKA